MSINITCTCSLLAGRLATNFHRKLIKVDPESLGTAGSWGIPHRISGDPSPMLCTSEGASILRDAIPHLRRDSGTVVQRGHSGSSTASTKLHNPNFPNNGVFYPVINLKWLNHYVRTERFKIEGLQFLPSLIQQEDWMVKLLAV